MNEQNENCHGGYEWDGVCLTVYVQYFLIYKFPLYMSLCNLMFNGNNKKKNTVFQSNMYSFISYLPWERSGQGVIHQFATSNFQQSNLQI